MAEEKATNGLTVEEVRAGWQDWRVLKTYNNADQVDRMPTHGQHND